SMLFQSGVGSHYYAGSGNHWSDEYRSPYENWMLMSFNDFQQHYGHDGWSDEGMWQAAQMLAQAPTLNDLDQVNNRFGTSFDINSNGEFGYWDMPQYNGPSPAGGAQATWVPAQQGGPNVYAEIRNSFNE